MSDLSTSGQGRPFELVLGFGNLSEESIQRGIATIADLLSNP